MDCRQFRDRHALLIDVRCSALEEHEMREHMRQCPRCAHQDALIRRSLFLVRNLAPIEPSPGFRARLDARLRDASARPDALPLRHAPMRPLLIAAAAVLVAVAVGSRVRRADEPIRMRPVVASVPSTEHLASPALVATVPTGMSIWPAIMAASQVPVHFVAAEFADER